MRAHPQLAGSVQLVQAVERLTTEFEHALSAGDVLRVVSRCRDELADTVPLPELTAAVESTARGRLWAVREAVSPPAVGA